MTAVVRIARDIWKPPFIIIIFSLTMFVTMSGTSGHMQNTKTECQPTADSFKGQNSSCATRCQLIGDDKIY